MKRQSGVTLIELLVACAIVGILGAVAVPAYRDYIIRGKLTDAQAMLGATRVRLEQYFQDNRSFPAACGATATTLPPFTLPTSQYFTYACAAGATAGQTYQLDAVGIEAQGTGGFTFRIDDQAVRSTVAVPTAAGWSVPATNCWVVKKPSNC
jgi:type IV pilus assembly protein PilE